MKKAKIMLTSIAIIAVVSGALAFKAHQKGIPQTYYFCATDGSVKCTSASTLANHLTTQFLAGEPLVTAVGTFTNVSPVGQDCTPDNCQQPVPIYAFPE
jgi:hypothetical protein